MQGMEVFQRVVDDPGGYLKTIKNTRKIVGYCCTYTPEEIIHAAGVHPVRIFGANGGISKADAHLQAYSCSLVRGVLEEALSGNLAYLDGMVFPHTCDSIQRLSDIWRMNIGFTWHTDVVLPVKLNTESAREYLIDVLRKFRRELGTWLGSPITDSALRQSIAVYNRLRALLKRVYELRSANPGFIAGRDVATIVKACMIMDRAEAVGYLETLVQDLETRKDERAAKKPKRFVIAGNICEDPGIHDLIENSGGVAVWDDLCTGSRFFEGQIADNEGNPVNAIAARYFERINCPAKHTSLTSRGDNLVRIVREHRADGVIFMMLKFCDPHAFDYPYLKGRLNALNIPSMLLEIQQEPPSSGQLATRFEAFLEMV